MIKALRISRTAGMPCRCFWLKCLESQGAYKKKSLLPVLLIEGGKYRCLKAFYKVKGDILAGLHGIMENDPLPMNKRFAIAAIGKIADCVSYPHILKTMKIHGMRKDVYNSLVDVVPIIAFRYINAGPESTRLHKEAWDKAIKEASTA